MPIELAVTVGVVGLEAQLWAGHTLADHKLVDHSQVIHMLAERSQERAAGTQATTDWHN